MKQEFSSILSALDYENQPFTTALHCAATINGNAFLCNSGQYLLTRQQALDTMIMCQEYLRHADDTFVKEYNAALLEDRQKERYSHWSKNNKVSRCKRITYIYLMLNHRNGLYKIGRSNNPKKRESTLQSEEPEISLILQFSGTPDTEIALHQQYSNKRIRGEWFKLDTSDVEAIKAVYDNEPF